jgi:L,D-transpeptidase catalytic domain
MNKLLIISILIFHIHFFSPYFRVKSTPATQTQNEAKGKYEKCKLKGKIKFEIFEKAYLGMEKSNLPKTILTIINFNQPSNQKRFFVIDLKNEKLLFETYTAHGKNSGNLYAKNFSNEEGSYQSSLGFYKTGSTYDGEHGYSLRLIGLEKGINDQAQARAIVIHGADYVSEDFIKKHKRLGRSWGCPALPTDLSKSIIDVIKNGTCLFIFADNEEYQRDSKF